MTFPSALLLLLVPTHGDPAPAAAGTSAVDPLPASEAASADWLDPSRALSAALADGLGVGHERLHADFLARGVYGSIGNKVEDELGKGDYTGLSLTDLDVALSGFEGPWSARVSGDLGTGGPDLEDTYLRWSDRAWGEVTVGRFKPNVLRSSQVDPDHLLFPTRSFLGSYFDRWDQGVEWHGRYDEFDWWLSTVDGKDGFLDKDLYVGRVEWSFYDEWWPPAEGARGAPDFLRLVMGFVYFYNANDVNSGNNDGFGYDLNWTLGPWAMAAEVMHLDDEVRLTTTEATDIPLVERGSRQPWAVTFSRRLDEELEAAVRFQRPRDRARTHATSFGLDWYPLAKPFAVQAEATQLSRDGEDGTLLRLGVSFGSTRHDLPPLPR